MKSPVPATCRHRRDKRRLIAHVVRHGASAVQVSRPSSSPVARKRCITSWPDNPSPRGLDRGSPRRPRRGTVVIAPPLPTVPGHGISRCHVHWGGHRSCGETAAPHRSDCFTVTHPHTQHPPAPSNTLQHPPSPSNTLAQQGCSAFSITRRRLCRARGHAFIT